MVSCDHCAKEVAYPFKCQLCQKLVCQECRLPESHNCCYLSLMHTLPKGIRSCIRALLQAKDATVRENAARALGTSKDKRVIDFLVRALNNDESGDVRIRAAKTLDFFGWIPTNDVEKAYYLVIKHEFEDLVSLGEHIVIPLIQMLQSTSTPIRGDIIRALGQIRDARAVVPLIQTLHADQSNIRALTAKELASIGDSRAFEPIVHLLHDPNTTVQRSAITALGVLGDSRAVSPLLKMSLVENAYLRRHIPEAIMKLGDSAVPFLLHDLKTNEDADLRKNAAKMLDLLDWEPKTDLDATYYYIGCQAFDNVTMLGNIAVDPLVQILRIEKTSYVRSLVAEALDALGWTPSNDIERVHYFIAKQTFQDIEHLGNDAVLPLLQYLADEPFFIQKIVIEALTKLGDVRAIPLIRQNLESAHFGVQLEAIRALSGLRDLDAIPTLRHLLDDESSLLRSEAAAALSDLGWTPDTEQERVSFYIATQQWDAVVKVGRIAVTSLLQVLNNSVRSIRAAAADALGKIGDPLAVDPLILKLNRDPTIRLAVIDALANIGDISAFNPLFHALNDDDPTIRRSIVRALSQIGDPQIVIQLLESLQEDNKLVQQEVQAVLQKLRSNKNLKNSLLNSN